MDNRNIYEAVCASSDGVVVCRRKSAAMPAAMFFVGAALVAASYAAGAIASSGLLSFLGLAGGLLLFAGGAMAVTRIYGDGSPYHTGERRFLKVEELKFAKNRSAEVVRLVREGDFEALRALSHDGVSSVTVTILSSPAGTFKACQAFEFIDLEMRPISELKVVCDR